ncbi:MAG: hypothetical protein B6229_00725 [Spirochaetaceae bacterium 4572_7]|nr:MAG: hypothetical protein B6229_00725 [Spirochaetaceae bacterium 4572_7]
MYKKFNKKINTEVITIAPGEIFVSKSSEVISTVLGSCISVCLFDEVHTIGGMNHFMLPFDRINDFDISGNSIKTSINNKHFRYGIYAMEELVSEMQKKGARRENFKAKIFGGGNVIHGRNTKISVGYKNIEFANFFLNMEGIPILSSSTGDDFGREVIFFSGTNRVLQKKIHTQFLKTKEESYINSLKAKKSKTDITLF